MEPAPVLPIAPWTREVDFVFVMGCPRSGTTWLQALLGAHPGIYTAPETHFFHALAGADRCYRTSVERNVGPAAYHTEAEFYGLLADLYRHTVSRLPAPPPGCRWFLDKTPHYSLHAAFILRVFPRARFVHIVRDARAVVPSLLRAAGTWGRQWAPRNLDEACAFWERFVRSGRAVRTLVADPRQYREVTYEALRARPAPTLRELVRGLDLAPDDGALQRAVAENGVERARTTRGLQGISPSPRDREQSGAPNYPAGFFGPAVAGGTGHLPRWARRRIDHLTGNLLRELGYADIAPPLSLLGRALTCPAARRFTPPAA